MKINEQILAILDAGQCEGPRYFLPQGQLDRATYQKVNQILELAGGKWNRGAKAHIFEGSAEDALEDLIQTGEITDAKKEYQFFETTAPVVNRILQAAELMPDSRVLEPSAGHGAIAFRAAEQAKEVMAFDLNEAAISYLRNAAPKNVTVAPAADFLELEAQPIYSHVLMNPPFSKGQDARHILRAWEWLAPGGRLVAVASAGVKYRATGPYPALRNLIDECGIFEDLPEGSFSASGTEVNTILITLDKPH